jgi:hypothetical protein
LDDVGVEEMLMVHDFAVRVLDIFIITVKGWGEERRVSLECSKEQWCGGCHEDRNDWE